MHLNPIYPGAVLLLSMLVLLFVRARHRIVAGRELMYFLGQDNFVYILIDIRSSRDYKKKHITGASNVPYPDCLEYLPTENMFEKIFIYGSSRHKARITAKKMSDTGYFNVTYFGAFSNWKGPVEKDNE